MQINLARVTKVSLLTRVEFAEKFSSCSDSAGCEIERTGQKGPNDLLLDVSEKTHAFCALVFLYGWCSKSLSMVNDSPPVSSVAPC